MALTKDEMDRCISCKKELVPWERNRAECLDCREKHSIETYGEADGIEENNR